MRQRGSPDAYTDQVILKAEGDQRVKLGREPVDFLGTSGSPSIYELVQFGLRLADGRAGLYLA
jgi:hypothetical protein